mmetsp:Transcript_10124/g.30953  ORF Transcript_10124/g.30953 Transcript_10124/m.30953 type:complete len:202 (-) Transcript_10124:572-1177(-)
MSEAVRRQRTYHKLAPFRYEYLLCNLLGFVYKVCVLVELRVRVHFSCSHVENVPRRWEQPIQLPVVSLVHAQNPKLDKLVIVSQALPFQSAHKCHSKYCKDHVSHHVHRPVVWKLFVEPFVGGHALAEPGAVLLGLIHRTGRGCSIHRQIHVQHDFSDVLCERASVELHHKATSWLVYNIIRRLARRIVRPERLVVDQRIL